MVNQEARVIVLVPTQPLAGQQRSEFDCAGFLDKGYQTATFVG